MNQTPSKKTRLTTPATTLKYITEEVVITTTAPPPILRCTASDGTELEIGETWTDPDAPCTTVSCLEDPNISTQTILKETVQMCPKCADGEKEMSPEDGQCCGKCVV